MAKAFLFDLNGTMIDDMQYHVTAWHRLLNEMGADISMERMKEECYGKANELIERILPGRFTEAERDAIGDQKETVYREEFRPYLKLLPGLGEVLDDAFGKGIRMAIGSAAIMANIDFVLDGLNIRHYFTAIVSADDVTNSKPDPETYLKCAARLNVDPADCLVFEDVPKGVESAARAGMESVVVTLLHTKEEFSQFENVVCFIEDFTSLKIDDLTRI
ncbi:MAG TPA: HAD family phosphatase [Flavitalea sp.]|nr:HAD family phosphatase [Flavitalea sp.]